jgi:type I restriction enzyme R subunit
MSERSAVQFPMIKYAEQIGWQYLKPEEALQLRGGETGLYLNEVLEAQLMRLNPGIVDAGRAADIVRQLNLLKPTIEGNRDALSWTRGEGSVFVPDERRERNVCLIDFENTGNNVFHVTDEWSYQSTVFRNRADVVFLINGIPVALAETKKAGLHDGLAIGVDQVRRYHRETPEMLTAPQVFEVTQLLDFFYGPTWSTNRKNIFNWRDVSSGDYEQKVKNFFERRRFLRLLRDYIIFLAKDDELTKVILRQHQVRAVEKVVERIQEGDKRHGLIWHTQGSGKTLTMITIASRLLETPQSEKPTIIMLVDRNELESQLFKNITSYGIGGFKVAESKRDLRDLLASDYRGLILSMIHKFDDIPADINPRKSIIVLVDEAHRTTGGDLGNYLMGAIPNATYIGFTGTPIDQLSRGKGTFKVFGIDDPQGYLDKYSIAESIEDGTTVSLNYTLAPSDLRVDRETLEREFLSLAEAEGVSDVEELNSILDRAVELKEIMKAPQRVDKIAAFVAQHFRENVNPMGFKAFLVAVDREACALYKHALDRYLPPDWSEVVYSPAHNDSAELKKYYLNPDEEKKVRKDFTKKNHLPKILIVTEKLLTGFDAPILYCMYLDKPMRDHVLLQAIARVNRPYEDEDGLVKPFGFVLDFVGIFERLERALAFDSDIVASVIQNLDTLKRLFVTKYMQEDAPKYLPFTKGWDDKAKERAEQYFEDKKRREEFFTFFRQLQNLYEVLSPDAFLRPYMDDYLALAELYAFIREAFSDRVYLDKELTAKTKGLLHQYTTTNKLELPGAIHELGAKELALLKQSDASEISKILNLRKILVATVEQNVRSQPFLLSIGERAEELAQQYEDRHLTTQQVLAEFEKLAQEYVEADAERERLGLDANTFAIYTELKPVVSTITAEQAKEMNSVFTRYPDYQWNEQQKNRVRAELYKILLPLVGSAKMVETTNSLLRLQRV